MTKAKKLNKIDVEINGKHFNVYNASYMKVAETLGEKAAENYFRDLEKQAIATNNIDTRVRFMLREWDEADFDLTKKMDYFSSPVNKFLRICKEQGYYSELQKTMAEHLLEKRQEETRAAVSIPAPANDNKKRTWSLEATSQTENSSPNGGGSEISYVLTLKNKRLKSNLSNITRHPTYILGV